MHKRDVSKLSILLVTTVLLFHSFSLQVCDYAIRMSENVPMGIRRKLLSAWVQCKQMLQQSIPSKVFGIHEVFTACELSL